MDYTISFRVSEGIRKVLEHEAERRKINISTILRERIEMLTPEVASYLERMAGKLGAPTSVVLENIIIKHQAEAAAEKHVLGVPRLLPEFMRTENGHYLGGKRLYDLLYQQKVQELERTKEE